jgi:hypothetical protein
VAQAAAGAVRVPARAASADRKSADTNPMTRAFVPALFFCEGRFPARIPIAKPESAFAEYAMQFVTRRATNSARPAWSVFALMAAPLPISEALRRSARAAVPIALLAIMLGGCSFDLGSW